MSKSRRRSRSPIEMEQGEVGSSPLGQTSPDVVIVDQEDDFSLSEEEEEVEEVEEEEEEVVEVDASGEQPEKHEDEDSLEIKPPQRQAGKKDRHKHKYKEERQSTKERDRERNRDRERSRRGDRDSKGRPRDREKDLQREREDKARNLEKLKLREEELVREEKRREKSRKERERLEVLERERHRIERERMQREREHRDRLIRAERERERGAGERGDRNRRDDDRRRQPRQERREKEKSQRKEGATSASGSRSRSPHKKEPRRDKYEKRDTSTSSRDKEGRRRKEKEPLEDPHEKKRESPPMAAAPPSESEEYMETEVGEHSASEEDAAKSSSGSDSDSSDSGSDSSGSEHSSGNSPEKHPADQRPKSKFDDDDEEEDEEEAEEAEDVDHDKSLQEENGEASETESVRQSDREEEEDDTDQEDNKEYIEDTPPESPVELKPQLPPYFPAIQGCRNVDEFLHLNRIEEGTYGVVFRAKDKKTDEIVALKKLKMEKEKEGFPITSLREINTLLKGQHPNIVTVREIVVGSNIDKIYIVMDYVEHDLKSLMETMKEPFIIGEVKTLMLQLLRGVTHLHDNWIIHRDLKTSNLLLSHKGILKIGDFGLAREYGSPLRQYTPIVVTLWYRAPELLLGTKEYSCPIDMWSVGCIFAEFLTRKPLFPGRSDIDELNRIFKELGTPNEKIWPGVGELPAMKKCTFSEFPYNQLRNRFGALLTDKGFDLMNRFLTYNPSRRITGEQALNHEWFTQLPKQVPPSMFPTWPARSEQMRRTHGNSPKPPSGGKAFSKLLGEDDDLKGFHLGLATKGPAASGAGFALKF